MCPDLNAQLATQLFIVQLQLCHQCVEAMHSHHNFNGVLLLAKPSRSAPREWQTKQEGKNWTKQLPRRRKHKVNAACLWRQMQEVHLKALT